MVTTPALLRRVVGALSVLCAGLLAGHAQTIWIEGEAPNRSQVTPHPWWYGQVRVDELSGGAWLHHFTADGPGEASYTFEVPAAGAYAIWVRANPTRNQLDWKLGDGPWLPTGQEGASDVRNIAADGAPDLRFLGWIPLGRHTLAAGAGTIAFRMAKGDANEHHGGIDAICITTEAFAAQGSAKPGETPRPPPRPQFVARAAPAAANDARQVAAADGWAFDPGEDPATGAAIDLRALLNERVAGERGFIRLSEDRMGFVRGDGQPIRFWGVVADGQNLDAAGQERLAQFLARRGVNMTRVHANLSVEREGARITDINREALDGILRWVATCRRHGIYVTVSPFWAHARAPRSWGLEGYAGEQVWGLLFFNPEFQEAYRGWLRALYTTPNPYNNNIALKDDPTVAIAQAKNEDSLLFWTFSAIKPEQKRLLGRRFHAWAVERHGSIERARQAWGNTEAEGDDLPGRVLGFRNVWEMTGGAPSYGAGHQRRLADQLEFLTEVQRGFYADTAAFLRQLGVRSLTNAMNWRSADQVTLDDAERYSYTPMDVIAVNYYTGGAHLGENNGYRIDPGHRFTNGSVLRGTAPLPANLKQPVGHPIAITETAWVHPNLYQSEGPFLMTAYQSLTGVDITYWFAYGDPPGWQTNPLVPFWPVGDSFATWKWYGAHAMQAGQFPAFAIAFRRGYIQAAAEPVVYEERSLADLWSRRIPIISESGRFDPNRDTGAFAAESPVRQEIDRRAFFVGPVQVRFGGDARNNRSADLTPFIDEQTGDIRSSTGQLRINQRTGVATINAPAIQGVCGFLHEAGGRFPLADTLWQSTDPYASLVAVSVDGEPLRTSRRILVQAGTTGRLTGFTSREETFEADGQQVRGERIVHNGTPPWRIAFTQATLTLLNTRVTKATALDPNLVPTGTVTLRRESDRVVLELPRDTLYVLLE